MKILKDLPYGPHGERNLLDLYLPDNPAAPCPLVVCLHGGGWRGGDKAGFAWMAPSLADSGLALASLTYRFWPAGCWPAALDDARRAVRWLRRHAATYNLDPQRFGALGGSAGAHLAAHLALAETPDHGDPDLAGLSSQVRCVVDCYGPVDFPAMMDTASASLVEGFMGVPFNAASEERYRQASPLFLVDRFLPPFLIVHGTADVGTSPGQVPITISQRFHARLRQAGADSTLLEIPGAPHGFSYQPDSPYTKVMWAAALPFLKKHLA